MMPVMVGAQALPVFALAPLLTMLTGNDLPLSARRNGAWALSNFCRFHKKAGGQRTQLAAVAPFRREGFVCVTPFACD